MANDSALDSEEIEEETEEEVDKILIAIAGETVAQLPQAVRKERLKQPAQSAEDAEEEGADNEELKEIRARLAKNKVWPRKVRCMQTLLLEQSLAEEGKMHADPTSTPKSREILNQGIAH